jgi:hypothetical protein
MVSVAEDMCSDWSKKGWSPWRGCYVYRYASLVHGLLFISSLGSLSRALERKWPGLIE